MLVCVTRTTQVGIGTYYFNLNRQCDTYLKIKIKTKTKSQINTGVDCVGACVIRKKNTGKYLDNIIVFNFKWTMCFIPEKYAKTNVEIK